MLLWPAPEEANPYVRKLVDALAQRGVEVTSGRRLASLCARPGDASWLHVHWPEWMLHDPVRWRYRARDLWLRSLLDHARRQGLRVAWTAHNLLGHDDPHPDLGEAARRALLARCDLVLGHFAEAEGDLRARGFQGRFVCAPHPPFADEHPPPFADDPARARAREALGVTPGALLLVSPGAMAPYKNLPALAAALRATPDARVRWVVAGRAEGETLRRMREAERLDGRVRLELGFQPRARLAALIAASDAILLGHKDFYTSGAAVLGATVGAPVIAPARNHLASWRAEPFFVPLDLASPDAMAQALERVRAMGARERLRARAFAREADWARMAATLDRAMFEAAA